MKKQHSHAPCTGAWTHYTDQTALDPDFDHALDTEGLRIGACPEYETAEWAMHQPQGSQQLDVSALNFGKVSKGTCHLMSQRNLSSAKQVTKQQIAKQTSGVQG